MRNKKKTVEQEKNRNSQKSVKSVRLTMMSTIISEMLGLHHLHQPIADTSSVTRKGDKTAISGTLQHCSDMSAHFYGRE